MRAASVIFLVSVFLIGVAAIASPVARANGCTVTVTASDSIQMAVDAASPGDVVCLSGELHQSVTIGTSDIKLTSADPATRAILDGRPPADTGTTLDINFGIRLADGVSDVTIENLVIRHYHGTRGSSIQAWDVSTSDIKVENNDMLHNAWNGVLVGSEGGFFHTDWKVEDNLVENNGFVGIELTNCNDCTIEKNTVTGSGFAGIVVQARNTRPGSGPVDISDVEVEENTVTGGLFGIYVLSFTGFTGPPFPQISSASSLLRDVEVEGNMVTDATVAGIIFWAFNTAATAMDGSIEGNEVNCLTSSGSPSILVLERPIATPGTVTGVSLEENVIDTTDCAAPFADPGTG